ncbi:MAG: DUF5104 domain-containing protein [Oscillospiraceae bacterium]|nr:DUF5104 domain-containing protein [Oscillospiraceae bacterium]
MRFKYILPVALITSMLSSCVDKISEGLGLFNKEKTPSVSIITAPQIMFDEIIYALDNKDAEHLKNLFAPNALAQSPDIDEQIDEIMGFYRGRLVSNESFSSGSGSSHRKNGRYIYLTISPNIRELKTDEASYSLRFFAVLVDEETPNSVGLWSIRLGFKDKAEVSECRVEVDYPGRSQDRFDYTEWRESLYEDMSLDELLDSAATYMREHPELIPKNAVII